MKRFALLCVLAAAGLAGCKYDPNYGDGQVQCGPGGSCPGDLVCDTDNVCRSTRTDGGGGGGDIDASMEIDGGVDLTPPDTRLVSSPSAISGPTVTFILDSTEPGSSFRCGLDTPTLTDCMMTQSYMNLTAGSHTFRAAARDAAGNEDQTPVEYTWTVDPTVLDTTITNGPGTTSGPNPQFRFTSTRMGTFECVLEPIETAYTACTSPKAYTGLAERGAPGYTFKVRAKDTAGNVDDSPAQQTFLVDATGPTVSISAPAANGTVGTSFMLTFSGEAGATYTCQLDSQAPITGCTSGRTFAMVAGGSHTIRVTGTDTFGNVGTAAMVSFTVDDAGPTVTVSGNPTNGSTVNTTSANLTFATIPANEPMATFECKFNTAATFTACTNFMTSGLIEGTQTLQVRARDRFGNVGGTVTHSWTISPLNTTIFAIRTTPVAAGTRVRLQGPKVTGKTTNRFWMQEVDGNSTNPLPERRGITVRPTGFNPGDAMVAPGRIMTVIGTVAEVNGNTTLVDASYFPGVLQTPYNAKYTSRDSLVLLSEVNEGMFVDSAGRASSTAGQTCQDPGVVCIVTCDRATPIVLGVDLSPQGSIVINRDHNFTGVLEGNGASAYTYFVLDANEQSDACL